MFKLRYNGKEKRFKSHEAAIEWVQERNQNFGAIMAEYGA